MKKIKINYKTICLVSVLGLLAVSCINDDPMPLRDPSQTGQPLEIDWYATADSIQEATYTQYLGAQGTFVQDNQGNATHHYWWNAHMLDVYADAYERTNDAAYVQKMNALLTGIRAFNNNSYNRVFNDDMEWLASACIRAYNLTGDTEYKTVAEDLWAVIKTSWSDLYGGGITWRSDQPLGKNAVSNAPGAIVALRLYDIDQNEEELQWAIDIFEWQKNTLVDPQTAIVWDNINQVNGEVVINDDWVFTYNMGTYIGAALRLYAVTGDQMYLTEATKCANTLMTSPQLTTEGILRNEGQGDGGLFKGILVRYFIELIQNEAISESNRQNYLDFIKFNAETLYEDGLARPQMLAGPDWRNQATGTIDFATQLSGVMLIEAAAKLEAQDLL